MDHTSLAVSGMRSKRRVYVTSTLLAMAVLLPFQHHAWAPYAAACVGYTILVLGLRRLELTPRPNLFAILPGSGLATHALYLAIAMLWVWFLIVSIPYLPYILRTEDTSHPYFGLTFIGVLGLLLLEAAEQRSLRLKANERSQESLNAARGSRET